MLSISSKGFDLNEKYCTMRTTIIRNYTLEYLVTPLLNQDPIWKIKYVIYSYGFHCLKHCI